MRLYYDKMSFFKDIISPLDRNYNINISVNISKECIQSISSIKYTYTYFTDALSSMGNSIPNFFSGLSGSIHKIEPLLSDFYLNHMLNETKFTSCLPRYEFRSDTCNVYFSQINLVTENNFLCTVMLLLNNRLFKIVSLSIVVYLMQKVSGILSNNVKLISYFADINHEISHTWFVDLYNYITNKSSWVHKYIYIHMLTYKRICREILLKIYNNIKNLITRFYISYTLSLSKFVSFKGPLYLGFVSNIISFNGPNFNTVYASLTVVYLFLGWVFDYISFIWVYLQTDMSVKSINTLAFWYKHFLYGITYILWLCMGVLTTNGIYFSILEKVKFVSNINVLMATVGSIITYISSNLWYFYGGAIRAEPLNLLGSIQYNVTNSWLTVNNRNNRDGVFKGIWSVIYYWLITPNSFNYYSSLRRSILEWCAFLGMVLSTYGTWNLYTAYAFSYLSVIQHIFVWGVPALFFGYGLIYLEIARARLCSLYYGLFYLTFWTCICFSSNSVLLGYITVNNAAVILRYIIPINFLIALVYSLPLYRANLESSLIRTIVHLLLFVLLTYVTLISAGTIWSILP